MIQSISVDIATALDKEGDKGASTEGAVYLGLGGREFRLDIHDYEDFEAGEEVTYVLGEGANVLFKERNDPRLGLPLSLDDTSRHPVYIRLEPHALKDDWKLANVRVRITSTSGTAEYAALQGHGEFIWLGLQSGNVVHLRKV